jgi:hypothetical protein
MTDPSPFPHQYFFQVDSGLDWSTGTNGTEEIFDQYNKGPQEEALKANPNVPQPAEATEFVLFSCSLASALRSCLPSLLA